MALVPVASLVSLRGTFAGLLLGVLGVAFAGPLSARDLSSSDDTIRDRIIAESIASYPGNCACPYSTMRNGRACGGRSAYSRPGGRSPVCYRQDIGPEMVNRWRSVAGR